MRAGFFWGPARRLPPPFARTVAEGLEQRRAVACRERREGLGGGEFAGAARRLVEREVVAQPARVKEPCRRPSSCEQHTRSCSRAGRA